MKSCARQKRDVVMSMINCPDCGKEISDKAVSCPNCGYPLSQSMELASLGENAQKTKISEPTISCLSNPDRIVCPTRFFCHG